MIGVKMMRNEQCLQSCRGADHGSTDTGGKHTECNQVRQRVDLDPVFLFHLGTVVLGAGYPTVESITQTAEQKEKCTDIRMTGSIQRNNDSGGCGQQ